MSRPTCYQCAKPPIVTVIKSVDGHKIEVKACGTHLKEAFK